MSDVIGWCRTFCPTLCFYTQNFVSRCDVRYDFRIKTMLGSSLPPLAGVLMSYLCYLYLFVSSLLVGVLMSYLFYLCLFGSSLPPLVGVLMSYLCYLCLFGSYSTLRNIQLPISPITNNYHALPIGRHYAWEPGCVCSCLWEDSCHIYVIYVYLRIVVSSMSWLYGKHGGCLVGGRNGLHFATIWGHCFFVWFALPIF